MRPARGAAALGSGRPPGSLRADWPLNPKPTTNSNQQNFRSDLSHLRDQADGGLSGLGTRGGLRDLLQDALASSEQAQLKGWLLGLAALAWTLSAIWRVLLNVTSMASWPTWKPN